MIRRPAHQLQREISLHAIVDIRRAAGIETPSAVFILMAKNLIHRALHPARIARTQQRMHEDVVGLEHDICLELAAPVPIGMLLPQQPVLGASNAVDDMIESKIKSAEARLTSTGPDFCGLTLTLLPSNQDSHPNRSLVTAQLAAQDCNRLYDLWRQAKAHIFRHDLDLIDRAISFRLQIIDNVLHQNLGAEAPAVTATVFMPSSHSGRISSALSIR